MLQWIHPTLLAHNAAERDLTGFLSSISSSSVKFLNCHCIKLPNQRSDFITSSYWKYLVGGRCNDIYSQCGFSCVSFDLSRAELNARESFNSYYILRARSALIWEIRFSRVCSEIGVCAISRWSFVLFGSDTTTSTIFFLTNSDMGI